jgi:hypothetical protein
MHLPEVDVETNRYGPLADLAERWPGWRIERRDIPDAVEKIRPGEKLIIIDTEHFNEDPQLHLAHAVAHLDLHLGRLPAWFSDEHCMHADFLAEVRLDRDEEWLEAG